MKWGYCKGGYCDCRELQILVGCMGLNRSYAAFDFLKVIHGMPFHLESHLERFWNTMSLMRIKLPEAVEQVRGIVLELAEKNGRHSFGLKLFAVPMEEPLNSEQFLGELFVVPVALPIYPEHFYTWGSSLISFEYQRFLPAAKSTNYFPSMYWDDVVKRKGALEALFFGADKCVLETARSNIFACIDGRVFTPLDGVLKGVTRKIVLEVADASGIDVVEAPVPMETLLVAEEVFISSTTKGVAPIVEIDGKTIGHGRVGPISQQLIASYRSLTESS